MGRVFNAAEAERIVAVRSYLGVSTEFIALLCKHLKDEGKLTVRSLESTAIKLHDEGIVDIDGLFDYFDRREKAGEFESKVRSLYGLGSRAFSPAEKKILENWASLGIDEDMIEYAYELTVNATGGASLKYSNAIVEKWKADGVDSVAEAKKREEEFRSRTQSKASRQKTAAPRKSPENATISSFDTEDFFEKALRRSYGDEFYEKNLKKGESGEN
jgi:DnaD/phage-associated family protein